MYTVWHSLLKPKQSKKDIKLGPSTWCQLGKCSHWCAKFVGVSVVGIKIMLLVENIFT